MYVTKTWNVVLLHKIHIYCYLKCIVYDKLLKPRQSFRITQYNDRMRNQLARGSNAWRLWSTSVLRKALRWQRCVQLCREEIEAVWDMQRERERERERESGALKSVLSERQWIQHWLKEQFVKKLRFTCCWMPYICSTDMLQYIDIFL